MDNVLSRSGSSSKSSKNAAIQVLDVNWEEGLYALKFAFLDYSVEEERFGTQGQMDSSAFERTSAY